MPRTQLGTQYAKLWSASSISNLGDGVSLAAVPLLAAALTRDPVVFAGVTVASRLPWLAFSLTAGEVADTVDRKKLVAFVDGGRFVVSALVGLGVLQGWVTIWHLYGAAFLLGTGEVFADIAAQVLMPAIVPRSELERANGRLFGAEIVTNQFAGPPLGSWLFAAVAASPFLFDAATFAAAALLVSWIRVSPQSHVAPSGERERPRIREGIELLWRNRLIRTLALLGSAMNALWTAGASILGLYALEVLGIEEAAFGLLLTASGVGYAAGSFTAARAIERLSRSRSLIAAAASEILLFVLFAAWPQPVVAGVGLAVFGYFSALWDVTAVSLRQSVVPDELLGRVNGAYRFIQWGSMPIGALLGGTIAGAFGLRWPWIVAAGVLTLALLVAIRPLASAGVPAST
ncbi:MAG TPA: MFS transporter [Actinomycetota bacterium]|jgi:MFS family permease|nr:MFS transporter [Actinomycetota bacterium]